MKKASRLITLMLFAVLFAIASCKKPQIDSISVPSTTGQVGVPVNININSADVTYQVNGTIDFGDGTTPDTVVDFSFFYQAHHTYTAAGTYTITVKESKHNKYPTSKTATITITP
ncbi:MAG TPA: PKD domain-containing protein [Bacteroidia bacterium]